jgi:hypothetical protein
MAMKIPNGDEIIKKYHIATHDLTKIYPGAGLSTSSPALQ